jgi:hypothetical protein
MTHHGEAGRVEALLMPVAADTGNLGYVGPIFRGRFFEYLPMKEESPKEGNPKYKDLPARNHQYGNSLCSFVVPEDIEIQSHRDPKFLEGLFTYGENRLGTKRRLWNLKVGDLIFFWSSLASYKKGEYRNRKALQKHQSKRTNKYLIGFFTVKGISQVHVDRKGRIIWGKTIGRVDIRAVKENQHFLENRKRFVVVQGDPKRSALLGKAVRLTERKVPTKGGKKRSGWAYQLNELGIEMLKGSKTKRRARYTQGIRLIYNKGKVALIRSICRDDREMKARLQEHL